MMNITVNEQGKLELEDLDKSCYFCGFDKVIHRHHIIPSSWGGLDESTNLLTLCPNCHLMLHKRLYSLHLNFKGLYFMISMKDPNEIIFPNKKQTKKARFAPFDSIYNAQKLRKIKVDTEVDNDSK